VKKNEHISSLKSMIRQTERDLARMKNLLAEVDDRLRNPKAEKRAKPDRPKQP
jgi:hypothetical protein